MTISVLLDPAQMPDQSQDQLDFDNKMSGLMRDLPKFAAELNATEAAMSAFASGGAYAFPYVFDTATADADPGPGKLRLSSATQNAATVLRADTLTMSGVNMSGVFDALTLVSSIVKGGVRMVKATDPTKWMLFDILNVASGSGYRNLTLVHRAGSSASPFAKDDALAVYIDRNGDAGSQRGATQLIAEQIVTIPVSAIAFPDVFSDLYDTYLIDIPEIFSTADLPPLLRLYTSQVPSAGTYAAGNAGGALANTVTGLALSDASNGVIRGFATVRGVRTANMSKNITFDGVSLTSTASAIRGQARRAHHYEGAINSGIGIHAAGSGYSVTGTVRIYGVGK